ncbi:MAG: NAD(P)/FAD-dependent oxidoreductase [Chitinophagaceae bacterium]|nr:NAD(P)/FAD-dependent oxidoreductase [Chitinophagaceae bacterium]
MKSRSAIIIGSGVAGIAAAIRLAVQDFSVTVYEKNSYPGGKLSLKEKDGFRFDAGPSLFTDPAELEELFNYAGEPIDEYISYSKVECGCKYFFANGKIFHSWADREKLLAAFAEKLNEPAETVTAYLHQAEKLYQSIGAVFLNHPLQKRSTWFQRPFLKALKDVRPYMIYDTLNEYHESKFKTGEAIQIFNRFATYNGSSPYSAPAMLSTIPHTELNGGVYYPKGGMISITNALYRLAVKKGVQFVFNASADRIICVENKARGIVINGENIFADLVISNADICFTYQKLLDDDRTARKMEKREKSSSALVFYWGIGKQFPQLQLHNIFFSSEYKAEFESLFKTKTVYKDPTIYINITSKMEGSHAPAGKENWFVMVNAPSGNSNWEEATTYVKQQILKKLRGMLKEDVEPHIETEMILDPPAIEANTGAAGGAIYGTSSNSKAGAFWRHPNFSKEISGLYFCGGTVHPGGGIPLCLKSAKIVGELIQYAKDFH